MGNRFPAVLLLCAAPAFGCANAAVQQPARAPAATAAASADGFSATEEKQLERGELVSRPMAFEKNGARYIGGISYQVVKATPDRVLSAIRDPDQLAKMLPRTQRVTLVDEQGPHRWLELEQGNNFVKARYTVVLEDHPNNGEIAFRLDRHRPHDIDDVYGSFRVQAMNDDRSIIAVTAALDVGSGIVRMFFENKIQALILGTAAHMRDVIEQRTTNTEPAVLARN